MPDFHVDGNPEGVRSRATLTIEKGNAFFGTGDALAGIDTAGWTGRAADHFRDAHDLEPDRWTKAGNGFVRAGNALQVYATELESAQSTAEWAATEYARGEQVTSDARSSYDADVSSARSTANSYLSQGIPYQLTIVPFDDPGAAIRENAVSEFDAARSTLEGAAQTCAAQVRDGCRDAPEEPGWLESGLKFVGGIFQGAGEAVWDLLTISNFSPINMVQDAWKLGTGDLTPEELAAKYKLTLETAEGMFNALKDDPVGFGKNLGKSLLDWDTWADDPARAIGHLVPDAVAAVFTGGTSAVATRGGKGLLDALDALGVMGRHADDLGDLGGLSKLDDLGDLNKLDDLDRVYSMMDDAPHTSRFAPEQLGDNAALDDALRSRGVDRDEFIDLVNKPTSDLTPAERDLMNGVRDDLPTPDADTVLQKVVPPSRFDADGNLVQSGADNYVMDNRGYDVTEVRGSISAADDTAHLGSPGALHDGLRLDYDGSPFSPDDASTHVIRFQTDTPGDVTVPRNSDLGGSDKFDGWDDPFTGNGFTKSGDDIVPEYHTDGTQMKDGAEMWEVLDNGNQRLVAVLRDGDWIPQGN